MAVIVNNVARSICSLSQLANSGVVCSPCSCVVGPRLSAFGGGVETRLTDEQHAQVRSLTLEYSKGDEKTKQDKDCCRGYFTHYKANTHPHSEINIEISKEDFVIWAPQSSHRAFGWQLRSGGGSPVQRFDSKFKLLIESSE